MAHPGRPKGRTNKPKYTTPQAQSLPHSEYNPHIHANRQYIPPQHSQAPAQANHPRSREDASIQAQDEADLIQFRQDAINRFIKNQEYIENITGKCIHTNKIIPPSLYPILPKRDVTIDQLKYDEVYFGDQRLMNEKSSQILLQITKLKSSNHYELGSEYTYQSQQTDKLVELCNEALIENLEKELETILQDYQTRFSRKYVSKNETKYSIDYKTITNTPVQVAPSNYNPRLINSFLNIDDDEPKIENNDNFESDIFINYENNTNDGYSNGSLSNNIPEEKGLESMHNYSDVNSLFKDQPMEENDVVDDMGDLINFDNDSDNEMMNVENFEPGFLNETN